MPLRNRVTPFGEIVATPERGTLMGNRGVLHDDGGRLVREWQVRRWIACRLEFRGRHRELLQPRRWTELFFLDEATAIAAGHRPCAECRNADYKRWQAAWAAAGLGPVNADAMDRRLHADRLGGGADRRSAAAPRSRGALPQHLVATLPPGTMVLLDDAPWLVTDDGLRRWTPGGYTERRAARGRLPVLTPAAAVAVLVAGYGISPLVPIPSPVGGDSLTRVLNPAPPPGRQ